MARLEPAGAGAGGPGPGSQVDRGSVEPQGSGRPHGRGAGEQTQPRSLPPPTVTSTAHHCAVTTAPAYAHTRSAHTPTPHTHGGPGGPEPRVSGRRENKEFGPWGPSPGPWSRRSGGSPWERNEGPETHAPAPQAPGFAPGRGNRGGRRPGTRVWRPLAPSPHRGRESYNVETNLSSIKKEPPDLPRN